MQHQFSEIIQEILKRHFSDVGVEVYEKSNLLQYLDFKTKAANRGAKSRGSFANLYAIYVVVEDYLLKGFDKRGNYSKYEGAEFNKLFLRQKKLPFGAKLQNHALNNRMNAEYQKYFPSSKHLPIIRNLETNRYWINPKLINIKISGKNYDIAEVIIKIIDKYSKIKIGAFKKFILTCVKLQKIKTQNSKKVEEFILSLLAPNADARLFEIVSYSILKYYYHDQTIYWGFDIKILKEDNLVLYKTGRTNANDGGIDFVMKPLGRYFQVTETLDVKKYFLDIDKIHRYPITFVIKSTDNISNLKDGIRANALNIYTVESIVDQYMRCIEEIINIPQLNKCFLDAKKMGYLNEILDEIILQSKIEFNYQDDEEE